MPAAQTSNTPSGQASESKPQALSVLKRINLTVKDGEFMVLVGPSGCGKSTLLRLIAGLESLTAGHIWVGEQCVDDLPPKARNIAMVFQSYALYPHMTVYDNLAFGLRRTQSPASDLPAQQPSTSGLPHFVSDVLVAATCFLPRSLRYLSPREHQIDRQVRQVAEILQIEALLDRLPKQLSGGQKQRVALGRAMARSPQVFLMDEPLSNLDAKLRAQTRAQIVKLQRQLGTTTVYVTHDQTEAMTMGDRIAVMNAGEIQQIAAPLELYHHPANQFVAEFIGSPPMNFVTVQVTGASMLEHPHFQLQLSDDWIPLLKPYQGQKVTLGIRPEHLQLTTQAKDHLPVQVQLVEALGHETYVSIQFSDHPTTHQTDGMQLWQARIEPVCSVQVGELLWFALPPDKIHLFARETGQSLGQLGPGGVQHYCN